MERLLADGDASFSCSAKAAAGAAADADVPRQAPVRRKRRGRPPKLRPPSDTDHQWVRPNLDIRSGTPFPNQT